MNEKLLAWLKKFPSLLNSSAVKWSACKSSGPGGQHVNKTNSKAILKIGNVFPEELGLKELEICSQEHRNYAQNQQECIKKAFERINLLIKSKLKPNEPDAEQKMVVSGHEKRYKERIRQEKQFRSEKKRDRQRAKCF